MSLPLSSGKRKRVLLVDCNNFFVSCERVFNPSLIGRPVVVLSNNDGCVIARSNEAKALDIPMGAPAFEYVHVFKKYNVAVLSSNFSLYSDMSGRVMYTLAQEATDLEIYSVDEAFLHLVDYGHEESDAYFAARAQLLVRKVKQYTGIPISVGIAPTKVLAKIANKCAKQNFLAWGGYCDLTNKPDIDEWLEKVPVRDIWGVGRRYAKMLIANNITTARALKYAPDDWVRKNMTINGLKMVHELRGIPCFKIDEEVEENKSFTVSRSFGKAVTKKEHLYEAIATHATSAGRKLRKQKLLAGHLSIFVMTRRHHDDRRYYDSTHCILRLPTSYTPDLITAAKLLVDKLFIPGTIYKKIGIIVADLSFQEHRQLDLLVTKEFDKQMKAMAAFDRVTTKWGTQILLFAAVGVEDDQPWRVKQEKKSPCFTTNWHEILKVKS